MYIVVGVLLVNID